MKNLLAIDTYEVVGEGVLTSRDQQVLTMLYQPLIGMHAHSLYTTLWTQWVLTMSNSVPLQHHHLLLTEQSGLQAFKEARLRLEGIGLLQTYVQDNEENFQHYLYKLQLPLSASQFFADGILNVMLYERLGARSYYERKEWFQMKQKSTEDLREVTAPFNDVFSPNEKMFALMQEIPADEEAISSPLNERADSLKVVNRTFDFDLFYEGLSGALTAREMFTDQMKALIVKLAYIYDLNIFQMQRVVLDAIDSNDCLSEEDLRKGAQRAYQSSTGQKVPRIYPVKEGTTPKNNFVQGVLSKEENLLAYLENVSPYQFLTDYASGAKPSAADLKIVEQVALEQQLPNGVINVLLYYTLLKSDMKLSFAYISKIAAHWSRKGVKTAKEAMQLAKSEQWTEQKKTTAKKPTRKYTNNYGNKGKKEVIPAWLNKEEELEHEENVQTEDIEQRRKKMEAWIASYSIEQRNKGGE